MAPLSEEEENYVRLALLLKGVTPRAVRTYFDREFHPTYLPSTLNKNYNTLLNLKLKKIIIQAQWNLMILRNGVPDSKTFDVTLMICLIRHLTSIIAPINGFDSLPLPGESTPGSDLARIKYYRNKLAHHDSNRIDSVYFNTAWRDISDAVGRLGGQTLYQECQELKVKILDQSNHEIMLEIKTALEEIKELKQTTDNLETELSKVKECLKDTIPPNIKDQFKKQIEDWETKDKMFVPTRASDYIVECLQDNSCVTLTAPSGVGKSFYSRHTALVLQKEGFKIIPVYSPTDIRDYYQSGKKTVFIVDDICGNFTANQQQIENWKQLLPVINTIIADKCCKIIVSWRLQVYKDEKFNLLSPFKSCECNLVSDKLCLTSSEKTNIAKKYIGTSMNDIDDVSYNRDFFPLLCSLYHDKKHLGVKEFFKNPFDVYQSELDKLSEHGDEGNYKICSLALCVLFNNQLEEKWFQGKVTDGQRQIIEDTCNACEINRYTSKAKLQKALDTLDGTFVCKQNGIYSTVHDKLFDFLAHYFGQKMIECLLDHADIHLVHGRFISQTSQDDMKNNIDFVIEIPHDHLESYLIRFIKDWLAGNVSVVFSNNNLKVPSFREHLLQFLNQLDILQQVTLANTKDTVIPKANPASGNTPLIATCYYGHTNLVQWILNYAVDVNQCRDNGTTGLVMASQEGHTHIVKLLLEKDPNVDVCDKDELSPLRQAIQERHIDIVKLLIESNSNVDLCDNTGCSPLLLASHEGHTEIVKLLLEKNPNVNLCDKNGCSPLYMASKNRHTDIVKLLLEKDPNLNQSDIEDCSPLNLASEKGYTDIVKLLLERSRKVDLCNNRCCSPLYMASQNGHTDIVKLLLGKDSNVNLCQNNGSSPLYIASQQGHTQIVKLLLEKDPNVDLYDNEGSTALNRASRKGYTDIVRFLIESNSNVDLCDNFGCSPLFLASHDGHTEIVKLLLEKDPNVNLSHNNGCSPLYMASRNGHTEIVKLLLQKDPDVDLCDKDGCSPLYFASRNGQADIVKLLLEKDPNVDLCNKNCCSPLYMASYKGHTEIVKLLLQKDPNVDLCDKDDCSPLYFASKNGHTDIVKLLLDKDPNIHICDNNCCSPLLMASQNGHTNIVKLLLAKDHNVDLCNTFCCSPLYMASYKGNTEIVKLLLQRDPNVDLCDKDGCSPLYFASKNGHTDIVKLLLEKDPNIHLCDNNCCSPLLMASQNGHYDTVKLLLENNPNVDLCDNNSCSPLRQAIQNGHTDIVKLLLEKDSNVDICDKYGYTPLMKSCTGNHTSIVQLLMKHKPDINAQSFDGGNALYFSALHGNIKITQLLLENNADCNMRINSKQSSTYTITNNTEYTLDKAKQELFDSLVKNTSSHVTAYIRKNSVEYAYDIVSGSSPLHIACFIGRTDVVHNLLDHNANINITKEDGTTPLFYACEVGHQDIVRLLLDKGADTQICRIDTKSPLDIAKDNEHTSIVVIVTEHMKKEKQLPL
ncbi:ankyrin-1-like [Mytilus californianus]|uniref:ankyrin-1-like n=1 Tax=Mytilus californianus TaxID=6549 RepID=UPI0022458027|nr:ankyrin-1-like [Mytilus californianus]